MRGAEGPIARPDRRQFAHRPPDAGSRSRPLQPWPSRASPPRPSLAWACGAVCPRWPAGRTPPVRLGAPGSRPAPRGLGRGGRLAARRLAGPPPPWRGMSSNAGSRRAAHSSPRQARAWVPPAAAAAAAAAPDARLTALGARNPPAVVDGLKYAKDHEWIKVEGDVATVGITDHAQVRARTGGRLGWLSSGTARAAPPRTAAARSATRLPRVITRPALTRRSRSWATWCTPRCPRWAPPGAPATAWPSWSRSRCERLAMGANVKDWVPACACLCHACIHFSERLCRAGALAVRAAAPCCAPGAPAIHRLRLPLDTGSPCSAGAGRQRHHCARVWRDRGGKRGAGQRLVQGGPCHLSGAVSWFR